MTLVLLGLAFCVFMWGLQYKLSLYDAPHSISHQMPAAKLLSRDEQATVAESLLLKSSRASDAIGRNFLLHVATCVLPAFDPLCTRGIQSSGAREQAAVADTPPSRFNHLFLPSPAKPLLVPASDGCKTNLRFGPKQCRIASSLAGNVPGRACERRLKIHNRCVPEMRQRISLILAAGLIRPCRGCL